MLNLLKEYSKKSPFQSRFQSQLEDPKLRAAQEDSKLNGVTIDLPFLREPKLKLVLEERFFVALAVTVSLYIFGSVSGNDWVYLLTSAALSTLVLGIVIPLIQVIESDIFFHLPRESVSKERLNLRVQVKRKSFLSRFGLGFLARYFPVKWLLVKIKLVRLGEKENMLRPVMIEHLLNEAWVVAQTPKLRRGVYNLESIEVFSCYPFGLAWWVKNYPLTSEFTDYSLSLNAAYDSKIGVTDRTEARALQMVVFPRSNNIEGNFLYRLRAAGDSALFFSSARPIAALSSSSVRSLREFHTGDSPRLIHWPTSAKVGKLMIREFESEGLPGFDVLLDLTSDWQNEEQFELAISISLSLLQLGFKLGGSPELYITPSVDEDIELLPTFLTDLPAIAPGIGWAAQILARVEALVVDPDYGDYQVKVPRVGELDTMALLCPRPATAKDNEDFDEENEEAPPVDPKQVDLWVMSRALLEADSHRISSDAAEEALSIKAPIPLHAMGSGDRRQSAVDHRKGKTPPGRVLSSLTEFEELPHI
ncbi:MAG: DUF58 domain-containing protein [Cyanobacteria bacterium REEB67]|nr:DUF58 domain-containing protein [Cyanobacteria bacterium REEB67]